MTLSAATVKTLYGTVLGGEKMVDALTLASADIGADGFVWNDLPGPYGGGRHHDFARQVSKSFNGVVFPDAHTSLATDPRVNIVVGRRNTLFVSSQCLGRDFGHDSYHREFLEGTLGTRYTMGFAASAIGQDHSSGLLGLHRMTSKGCFSDHAINVADELLANIRQVLRLQQELSATRNAASVGESVLDSLGEAVFVTDKNLNLQWTNRLGEKILREGNLIRLNSRKIRASLPWSAKLLSAISDVVRRAVVRQVQIGFLDNQPVLMTVAPSLQPGLIVNSPMQQGGVVLRISKPIQILDLEDRLKLLYGLTSSEANLARDLASGESAAEHSAHRGVKISTTRFHIRAILEKTSSRDLQALSLLLGRLTA